MSSAPTTRRRRFQFGTVSMLIMVTAIAVLLSQIVVPAWRQRNTVAAILDLGVQVSYDYQASGANAPRVPVWLRSLLGDDCFQTVTGVALTDSAFDDPAKITTALAIIARLPKLESVQLINKEANDEHLLQLSQLTSPTNVLVSAPRVTDAGMAHLGHMKLLRSLTVAAPITDKGLAHLASLKELRALEINAPTTDAGMSHFQKLAKLESLSCYNRGPRNLDENTDYGFEDLDVTHALDYFGVRHYLIWRYDLDAIDAAGLNVGDLLITDNTSDLTLREALERILTPLGLGFRIEGGQVVITTREEGERAHAGINGLRKALPNLQNVHVDW